MWRALDNFKVVFDSMLFQCSSENLRLTNGDTLGRSPVQDQKRRVVLIKISKHGKGLIKLGGLSTRLSESRNVFGIAEIDWSIEINDTVHRARLLRIRARWIEVILR